MPPSALSPTQPDAIRVDIISDVVCPWCIIGYRQLIAAARAHGTDIDVHWHPFELNPDMPAEGQNLTEHVMEKYGTSREESLANRDRIKALGDELGFEFAFTADTRMYNTFDAHQLIHWADTQGHGNAMKQALFTAHFTENRDLSDKKNLAQIAAGIGLDQKEALENLTAQTFANDVRSAQQAWLRQGITGVPAMVFERKYLVTGAQGVENYTNILEQLTQLETQPAS